MRSRLVLAAAFLVLVQFLGVSPAHAVCTNPDGAAGSAARNDRVWEGLIDDVRIYNRELSADEVYQLYAARDGNLRYNADQRVPEYFNGDNWVAAGPVKPSATGLVGWWKLDEEMGLFEDSSGNGNDGTQSGGVTYASAGVIGNAAGFDGVDDEVRIPHSASLVIGAGDITASVWVKGNGTDQQAGILSKRIEGGTFNQFSLVAGTISSDGSFTPSRKISVLFIEDAGSPLWWLGYTTSDVLDDGWHHIAASRESSGNPIIYIDGSVVATTVVENVGAAPYDISNTEDWVIGSLNHPSSFFFNGAIDDVRVYNRALGAAEIGDLYKAGRPDGTALTALPQGCPNVGDVCDDGTTYAGLTPDGSVEMFVAPMSTRTSLPWNNGNGVNYTLTNVTASTGQANTNILVTLDSDSGTAGFQPHRAAQYCYDLASSGADDWYLPSYSELDDALVVMLARDAAIVGNYWASQEESAADRAERLAIDALGNLTSGFNTKNGSNLVLCVRKGPAPRCTNPDRPNGAIIYNSDFNLLQYCDPYGGGTGWRATTE